MNILKLFLDNNSNLKDYDIIEDIETDRTKKIALKIPSTPVNLNFQDEEIILRIPHGKCSNQTDLINVLDYLDNESRFFKYDDRFFKVCFSWGREIKFNSIDNNKNEIFSIPYKIKIEETNGN